MLRNFKLTKNETEYDSKAPHCGWSDGSYILFEKNWNKILFV